jgi:hypothetical protein
MKTTGSNVWGGRSGHTYTFTRRPDGTTDVDAVEGKNFKGRALGLVLGTVGASCKRHLPTRLRLSKPGTGKTSTAALGSERPDLLGEFHSRRAYAG